MQDKKDVPAPKPQPIAEQPKKQGKVRGWVTLERERSFGSVTGSEFRIWSEK